MRISPLLAPLLSPLAALVACAHPPAAPAAVPARPTEAALAPTKDQAAVVPVDPDDPVWGSATAPVTVVEFADFECTFCRRVEPTIAQLKTAYGPDKLRIVWKHFPLAMHPHARAASQAASAVYSLGGSAAFWKFHDALLPEKQMGDTFDAEAKAAGVDLAKYHAALATGFAAEQVAHDMAVGEKLGVDGTPAFFINGAFISGALPVDVFQQVIDEALKQATGLLAKGTAREDVYAVATRMNYTPPGADAGNEQANEPPEDTTTAWKVPIGASPTLGPATAPVTIVFFSDFQCPYCAQADATLAQVEKEYAGKLRVVWKNFPLGMHPRAEPAAELAFEARAEKGDAGFWDAHDRLFASQADLSDESLGQIAGDMGLDRAKVKKAIDGHAYRATIQADQALAAALDADGAPQTFINGRRLVGAQPAGAFRELITAELDHAAAMVKSGTPAASVYDTIIAGAALAKEPEKKQLSGFSAAGHPVRGPANAKVSIVELADFECSYCARAESTVRALVDERKGDVQLVWVDRPLEMHPHAELAAEAGAEAFAQKGNAGFWPLHDALFAHAGEANALTLDAIVGYATAAKVDGAKLKAALEPVAGGKDAASAHHAAIARDAKMADAADFNGTPTFLIVGPAGRKTAGGWTGYVVTGAQEPGTFLRAIDLARHEAEAPHAGKSDSKR